MSLENAWKNFIKSGNIKYYIEYKKLQDFKGVNNANNNRCSGVKSDGCRGE